jgi:hypothetical protein
MTFSQLIQNSWQTAKAHTPPVPAAVITPDFIRDNLHILNKHANITRYIPNRAQRHFDAHKTGRDVIVKSRQVGISTYVQAEDFVSALTKTTLCATLAHDSSTTAKLRRMAARFYDNLPSDIRPERGLDNATTTTYPATGSEVTIATAGSGNVGRGGTYNRVHGSEVAFWKNANQIMAGIMQGVTPDGEIVLESSPNGAQGYFYEICMNGLAGKGIWTIHFYEWWWADEYHLPLDDNEQLVYTPDEQLLVDKHNLTPEQIKWRRYKIAELGDLFFQEYPEDIVSCFLVSGRGVFQIDKPNLFTAYTENRSLIGHVVYLLDGYETNTDSVHVMGIDWGQHPDSTAVSIWDSTTYQEIALYITGKRDYEYIIADIVQLAKHFNVRYIVPERNSMRLQISTLARELQAAVPVEYDERQAPVTTFAPKISPFNMSLKSKDDLVKLTQQGINEGCRMLDVPVAKHELRIFEARQNASTGSWSYSHPDGEHDDTVITRMLGHLACFQLREKFN